MGFGRKLIGCTASLRCPASIALIFLSRCQIAHHCYNTDVTFDSLALHNATAFRYLSMRFCLSFVAPETLIRARFDFARKSVWGGSIAAMWLRRTLSGKNDWCCSSIRTNKWWDVMCFDRQQCPNANRTKMKLNESNVRFNFAWVSAHATTILAVWSSIGAVTTIVDPIDVFCPPWIIC